MNIYNSVFTLFFFTFIILQFIVFFYNFCNQLAEITDTELLNAQICTKIFFLVFLQFKEAAMKNFCQFTKRKY